MARDRYQLVEDVEQLASWRVGSLRVTEVDADNARIRRSPHAFRYQPYDEPRLHELRERYELEQLMAEAPTEFEGMVRLRRWARSQFDRRHYQRLMVNFDALEILERGDRPENREYDLGQVYDPCHFFPLFLSQLLVSVGHQARLVSVTHGMLEVWSNQYAKWVLIDAELDHHYERDGVPLHMLELARTDLADAPSVQVVASPRRPGEENPTMAHLRRVRLTSDHALTWFKESLEITEMRNDWMTNHYFSGHPARSEASSLVIAREGAAVPSDRSFVQRLRPRTQDPEDAYWTLNQAEVLAAPPEEGVIPLMFDTVTPNFDHFELVVDGERREPLRSSRFAWPLHEGDNTLVVRPVNQFGIRGVASTLRVRVGPAPGAR